MTTMTDSRAVEVLSEMREGDVLIGEADYVAAIDHAIARLREPAEARECKCNMRTKLVGDGCDVCNPEYAARFADDPAEAQAQGGGEERIPSAAEWVEQNNLEAAVSIDWRCGLDACRVEFPRTAPPSAPVGVEALNAAAVEAGHITFESMKQCADSWLAVVDALNTAAPGWCENKGTGRECAVAAIAALAQQPAAVDGYTTGHCERHKQPGGCDLHNLSCGWPSCDRRPAAKPGGSDNDR